jgi:hypothetical protein
VGCTLASALGSPSPGLPLRREAVMAGSSLGCQVGLGQQSSGLWLFPEIFVLCQILLESTCSQCQANSRCTAVIITSLRAGGVGKLRGAGPRDSGDRCPAMTATALPIVSTQGASYAPMDIKESRGKMTSSQNRGQSSPSTQQRQKPWLPSKFSKLKKKKCHTYHA